MNKKVYWEKFYSQKNSTLFPSPFCEFVTKKYNLSNLSITDFCCGNGRDTFHLAQYCKDITGVDFATLPESENNVKFVKDGIPNFIKDNKGLISYCRFGFHAFEEYVEDIIVENSTALILEFRSHLDNSFKDDHYRRLIDGNLFLKKLLLLNYNINFFTVGKNMAIYKEYNPVVVRVIASQPNFSFIENI